MPEHTSRVKFFLERFICMHYMPNALLVTCKILKGRVGFQQGAGKEVGDFRSKSNCMLLSPKEDLDICKVVTHH